jgi:hypothetical protein
VEGTGEEGRGGEGRRSRHAKYVNHVVSYLICENNTPYLNCAKQNQNFANFANFANFNKISKMKTFKKINIVCRAKFQEKINSEKQL